MRIKAAQQGGFVTEMSLSEALLLSNVLNEVCNGFSVPDFEATVGVGRERACELSKEIDALATVAETQHAGNLDIVAFSSEDLSALKNALKATLDELGAEEFSIRTGYDFEEGCGLLRNLALYV